MATVQSCVDATISKTVRLPQSASELELGEGPATSLGAWTQGLRGVPRGLRGLPDPQYRQRRFCQLAI